MRNRGGDASGGGGALEFTVDAVYLISRKGGDAPFEFKARIPLGGGGGDGDKGGGGGGVECLQKKEEAASEVPAVEEEEWWTQPYAPSPPPDGAKCLQVRGKCLHVCVWRECLHVQPQHANALNLPTHPLLKKRKRKKTSNQTSTRGVLNETLVRAQAEPERRWAVERAAARRRWWGDGRERRGAGRRRVLGLRSEV